MLAARLVRDPGILDVLGTVVTLALALFGNRSPTTRQRRPDPGALEKEVAAAAERAGTSRDQVVAEALDRYFARTP